MSRDGHGTETAQHGRPDHRAVLVYDGECPMCSAASSAMRRLDSVGAVAWDDPAAQRFLEAQFGETPFALVFADRETARVWVGREAARELCERAGLPVLVQDLVGENYETLADAVQGVAGTERDPDAHHGTFPLADAAAETFSDLAANAETTHVR